jgi:large subunit ribosomal protein L13
VPTYSPKKKDTLDKNKKWYVVDAEDKILGRLATEIAVILRGKNKPTYSPHMDMGDHVIVINAEKIKVTGKKMTQKKYYRHTGYVGHLRETSLEEMLQKHPERVIYKAVKGMMPKNKLSRKMIKKLRVYAGSKHPHQAQQPEVLEL